MNITNRFAALAGLAAVALSAAEAGAPEVKVKRSLAERILDAEATLARLRKLKATEDLINNVDLNDDVTFTYGRAGLGLGKREFSGVVTAKGDTDFGLKLAITVGTGIDAEVYKVFARDLTENKTKGVSIAASLAADEQDGEQPEAPVTTEANTPELSDADRVRAQVNGTVDPLSAE